MKIFILLACLLSFYTQSQEKTQPIVHPILCFEPWFSHLKSGIKPVEGRKNSPIYQSLQVGDLIEFKNEHDEIFMAEIIELRRYPSLEEYLSDVTYQKAVPGTESFEDAVNIYLQWSTREEIKQYGFLGIFIKLL